MKRPLGQVVERHRRHRRGRRRARAHLHDAGAELDALGVRAPPRQRGEGVAAVRLGGPHRGEAEAFGLLDRLERAGRRAAAPVAAVVPELHVRCSWCTYKTRPVPTDASPVRSATAADIDADRAHAGEGVPRRPGEGAPHRRQARSRREGRRRSSLRSRRSSCRTVTSTRRPVARPRRCGRRRASGRSRSPRCCATRPRSSSCTAGGSSPNLGVLTDVGEGAPQRRAALLPRVHRHRPGAPGQGLRRGADAADGRPRRRAKVWACTWRTRRSQNVRVLRPLRVRGAPASCTHRRNGPAMWLMWRDPR